MRKVPFSFKIEEFIPFCDFVVVSYTTDRPAFINYSLEYDGEHLTICVNKRDAVDAKINPKTLTAKLTGATKALYKNLENGLTHISEIERYCEKAKIPLDKKTLGITNTRRKCNSRDAEGAIEGLKLLRDLISPYITELEAVGYTKTKQESLNTLLENIKNNNVLQNTLINQRATLVQDNIELIIDLWDVILDILKTGKVIFRDNPAKIKEYTQARILARLRNDAAKTTESNTSAVKNK